jgi:hypothetical protein
MGDLNGFRSGGKNLESADYRLASGPPPTIFAESRNLRDCLCGWVGEGKDKGYPCKLTLFVEMGRLKISINDPTRKLMGFGTLDLETGLVDALEHALGDGGIEWRKQKERQTGGYRGPGSGS